MTYHFLENTMPIAELTSCLAETIRPSFKFENYYSVIMTKHFLKNTIPIVETIRPEFN